jgi:hypothetical protein
MISALVGIRTPTARFLLASEKLEPTRPWVMWVRGVIAAREGDRETALLMIKRIAFTSLRSNMACLSWIYPRQHLE